MPSKFIVSERLAGSRLDQALRRIVPHFGLRGCRRLLLQNSVTVNGRPGKAAWPLKSGDTIEIDDTGPTLPDIAITQRSCPGPFVIHGDKNFIFIFKPAGMHTTSLAGKADISLQSLLPLLVPGERITMLQRLDYGTCGIICGARHEEAASQFKIFERHGLCRKFYLALLQGEAKGQLSADFILDTTNRKKVRIMRKRGGNLCETRFIPLNSDVFLQTRSNQKATWCVCEIKRGERHQIRAHAAMLGFPLKNDALYGQGGGDFCLRAFGITFPGHDEFFLENAPGAFHLHDGLADAALRCAREMSEAN